MEIFKMENLTITISKEELTDILYAYHTMNSFIEKIISPNDIYLDEFLIGLEQAKNEINSGKLNEVKDFNDFIA
jgi:hypothetical protein